MVRPAVRNVLVMVGLFLCLWLGVRYFLPVAAPFLLGGLLALAAEPGVQLLCGKCRLPRWAASGLGVTAALLLALGAVVLLCALLVREMGVLTRFLPGVWEAAEGGIDQFRGYLLNLAGKTPEGIRSVLQQGVDNLFGSGTLVVSRVAGALPGMATRFLSRVPGSALSFGTGLIAAYMISARLPRIRAWVKQPQRAYSRYLPVLNRIRGAVFGWLRAQCKLTGVSFCILLVGLLVLRVPFAPVWALAISFVDALPLLGTGVVLLPWAALSLLRREYFLCAGLVGVYLAVALTRTLLEPRLVGRQLGIDPLVTLAALYMGYRFWGLGGMLLAPVMAVIVGEIRSMAPQ